MTNTTPSKTTIDVRNIPPRDRHALIFSTFESLAAGEALTLVNDHAPKPLYYQFLHEYTDQFTWDWIEDGPEVWQVRIGKK